MLCDAHIHYIPQELSVHTSFYKGIWTDKRALYGFLDEHKIEKGFLVYPSTDAHLSLGGHGKVCDSYNRAAKQLLKENPKIVAAGIIDIDNLATVSSRVEQLKAEGFAAISIASSYNGRFMVNELIGLFEAAQRHGMAVFIHPQTINPIGFERVKDPLLMPVLEYSFDISMYLGLLMMEGILQQYDVKFIFSSLAGVTPFLRNRFDRVYTMLRNREIVKDLGEVPSRILTNVFVDTSGSSIANIRLALDLFGADRVLWGSDYPVSAGVKENLEMLEELGSEVNEKITHKNFLNLF